MEFREYARGETDAFVERLAAAAEAVRSEFEARVMALEADLESAFDAHRRVDEQRTAAEAAHAEEAAARAGEAAARERAEEEVRAARELLERVREEAARLAEALQGEAAQKAIVCAELDGMRAALDAARGEADVRSGQLEARLAQATEAEAALRAQLGEDVEQGRQRIAEAEARAAAAETLVTALREQIDGERQSMKAKGERLVEEFDTLRGEYDAATESLRDVQEQLDALHDHYAQRVDTIRVLERRLELTDTAATAMLKAAVDGLDALDAAPTVAALFAALVEQLGAELPRVALFRVKGNHLEGEHAAGLGDAMHVKKLVVPLTLDSLIARAVARGALERAEGEQLAEIRAPFGDTPSSALATPIVFRGETLAVVYADSGSGMTEAQVSYAALLVRHTTIALAKLTQELKTVKELREYAAMLLQEAQQMFQADVEAGSPEQDCVRRLQDALDCGRELYAQRAALEGTFAADIFEDQMASIVRVPESRFAKALLAALAHPHARRTAS